MPKKLTQRPSLSSAKNILLLKHYGVGIGDVVRSTASWKSIKELYPDINIHMFFWPLISPSPAEYILKSSGYLASVHILKRNIIKSWLGKYTDLSSFLLAAKELRRIVMTHHIEFAIDQEVHGIENSILSLYLNHLGVHTIGIAQYPFKRLFYNESSVSEKRYSKKYGLRFPMDYTNKDYIALERINVFRNNTRITIEPAPKTISCSSYKYTIGINIGCGPNEDSKKRPQISLFSNLICYLLTNINCYILLTGTRSESWINEKCISFIPTELRSRINNIAGETDIESLIETINGVDLYISTDSGPFHLSVALGKPTIGIFKWANPTCYHTNDTTSNIVVGGSEDISKIASEIRKYVNR